MKADNAMQAIRIAKITLNIGAGKSEEVLKKGMKLLKTITGMSPVKTFTKKRIPGWGLRPGLAIGGKVTLRGEKAREMLKRLLEAADKTLSKRQFDKEGNFAFGIGEYIDIPGVEYDPEIKMMGLEVAVTLERPGFRIKRRKQKKKSIPQGQRITKEGGMGFMKKEWGIKIAEEEV